MKHIVCVEINKNITEPKYSMDVCQFSGYDFELVIYNNGELSFEELISDTDAINEAINKMKSYNGKLLGIDTSELTNADDFLSSIELVSFNASKNKWSNEDDSICFDEEEYTPEESKDIIDSYLSTHPEYVDMSILIPDIIDVGTDIASISEKYKDYKDVLVLSKTSFEPMPLEIAKNGSSLDAFIYDLKSLKLSPLEYAILVYDIVREKPYKFEKKGVSISSSRETYQALSGDDIVCLGYANLYSTIMSNLGINSSIVTLKSKKNDSEGHARNVIRIEDSKYNVNGIFFVDPTMDSRNKYDLYKWLYSYNGFMKKKPNFYKLDLSHGLYDKDFGYLDRFKISDTDRLFELFNLNPVQVVIMGGSTQDKYYLARLYVKNVLKLYEPITDDMDNETIINIYKKYKDRIEEDINNPLYMSNFIRALIRVRYIEHKISPLKYFYDLNLLFSHIPTYGFDIDKENIIKRSKDLEPIIASDREEVLSEEQLIRDGLARIVSEEAHSCVAQDAIGEVKIIKSIKLYNRKNDNKIKVWK